MTTSGPDPTVTLSEERLAVGIEQRPFRRVRVTKRVVTERRMIEVDLRREEMVIEELDVGAGDGSADHGPAVIELTLSEERAVVEVHVVPVERVRISVVTVASEVEVTTTLASERAEVVDPSTESR